VLWRASSQASQAAAICVVVPRADAPPVGVWKREGAGAGSEWWTAGGCGYTTSWDVHTESSAPFLF